MSTTLELAREIADTKFEDIPPLAAERIKMAIIDDVGIAFLGYQAIDKPLVDFAKAVGGVPESTIIGDGSKTSCGLAAGVNAEMASYSNYNET